MIVLAVAGGLVRSMNTVAVFGRVPAGSFVGKPSFYKDFDVGYWFAPSEIKNQCRKRGRKCRDGR
jgi:hypothetical protein